MATEIQAKANRRNGLQSTGPKTANGIEAARFNSLRHGLRALQTVIPGEDPKEWETHRAVIVEDLKPVGAVELALAEQIAAKLWRLGRVVRHEADVIAIGQAPDELANAHEAAFKKASYSFTVKRTDIPTFEEVQEAASEAKKARQKADRLETAIKQIESIGTDHKKRAVFDHWGSATAGLLFPVSFSRTAQESSCSLSRSCLAGCRSARSVQLIPGENPVRGGVWSLASGNPPRWYLSSDVRPLCYIH